MRLPRWAQRIVIAKFSIGLAYLGYLLLEDPDPRLFWPLLALLLIYAWAWRDVSKR